MPAVPPSPFSTQRQPKEFLHTPVSVVSLPCLKYFTGFSLDSGETQLPLPGGHDQPPASTPSPPATSLQPPPLHFSSRSFLLTDPPQRPPDLNCCPPTLATVTGFSVSLKSCLFRDAFTDLSFENKTSLFPVMDSADIVAYMCRQLYLLRLKPSLDCEPQESRQLHAPVCLAPVPLEDAEPALESQALRKCLSPLSLLLFHLLSASLCSPGHQEILLC